MSTPGTEPSPIDPEVRRAALDVGRSGTHDALIEINGARSHNLKGIDVVLPKSAFVVATGVSGSGKSSLVFDTLHAEGQRRYAESLSPYLRRNLPQPVKPDAVSLTGLSPTVAIDQHAVSRNPRSSVGSLTELADHLRLLYARAGRHRCLRCGADVAPRPFGELVDEVLTMLDEGPLDLVLVPTTTEDRGPLGIRRSEAPEPIAGRLSTAALRHSLDPRRDHLVATLVPGEPDATRDRVAATLRSALRVEGSHPVAEQAGTARHLDQGWVCGTCGKPALATTSTWFSPNTPQGMCPTCEGLGFTLAVDADILLEHPDRSIRAGALSYYGDRTKHPGKTYWPVRDIPQLLELFGADLDTPWRELPAPLRDLVLQGETDHPLPAHVEEYLPTRRDSGLVPEIERLFRAAPADRKIYYEQFMRTSPCPACAGDRLGPEARAVRLAGQTIARVGELELAAVGRWLDDVIEETAGDLIAPAAKELVDQLRTRLAHIIDVGLGYLSLSRPAPSLSAGEAQRLRIARQLGSGLVDVIYVLDEPTIGLHPTDTHRLIATLRRLVELGNTIVVVEHDLDVMAQADWIVDLGPGAGRNGGHLLGVGPPAAVERIDSPTGAYLRGDLRVERPGPVRPRRPGHELVLRGVTRYNVADLTATFPLGLFVAVTGVSGSGKSTLVMDGLLPAAQAALGGDDRSGSSRLARLDGVEDLARVVTVDQSPIGRTSRSVPATYIGVFDEIRKVFAKTPAAKARGLGARHFSFNTDEAACPSCGGTGEMVVEMHFMADVAMPCPQCDGARYDERILEVRYEGISIADVLALTVDEAREVFADRPRIAPLLDVVASVGLGYLQLGQTSSTLSGGEAQRLKLSRELGGATQQHTLYLIDEPTTGLHPADVQVLVDVLHHLVDRNNTLVVIEHNVDLIRSADWIIDMGPGGGRHGGRIVAQGTPEDIARSDSALAGPLAAAR